jgi:tRNA(fMet)-specific endonuclease VapC
LRDVLIGATALHHGLAVVSRNVRHLSRIQGLVVESWWG